MQVTDANDRGFFGRAFVVLILLIILSGGNASADCTKNYKGEVICGSGECQRDRYGNVACSAYRDGAAVRSRTGEIVCGKGKCVSTSLGDVYCSTVPGGAIVKDRFGEPRCEGACEPANVENCVAVPAGTL